MTANNRGLESFHPQGAFPRNHQQQGNKMNHKAKYRFVFAMAMAAVFATSALVRASETDGKIESSFKKTYVYKTYLMDDSIKVNAEEGAVTLKGTVADESHKSLAQETVASLPGVNSVDNQLTTKAEDATESADTWIGRKIKMALMFHRNVSGIKTDVTVKDGVATLKGEAANMAQKELTAEYAADIEGVKSVNNEIAVVEEPKKKTMSEKIDDASVTAQVKTALLTHRSTSAISTKVETQDGVVTVTGVAKNAAEKALVTKLVSDIQGATSVKNEMTIKAIAAK
jgi:osmotically-inducible protein OsmY